MSTVPDAAFTCELAVRWSDQDLNGHVNNARVATLVEESRVQADREWSDGDLEEVGGRVVRSIRYDFDRPLHYPVTVHASVWVGRIGNTSFTLCHELAQNGERCVYSEAVMVTIDPETGRPARIDDAMRDQLSQRQAS